MLAEQIEEKKRRLEELRRRKAEREINVKKSLPPHSSNDNERADTPANDENQDVNLLKRSVSENGPIST